MLDYNTFLSRAGRGMHASAIRRAGDIGASMPDLVSLAPGFPDPSAFAWDEFRGIAGEILTGSDPSVLQYGPTRGYRPLLEIFPEILSHRGIHATSEEVIVTTGSQQALDLCARVFADPGDVAVVERPAYTGGLTAFANAQASIVGVRQDVDGVDLDHLDATVQRERDSGRRVAFVYVVPNFQNPTGLLMTRDRRVGLLEWAARRDVLIVEDDPYGALYFEDLTAADETRPIKADDADGRVVYLSSFSKTVAPGFRVAWITAAPAVIAKLEIAKQSADLCSGGLDQRLIYEVWTRGILEARLPLLRDCYRKKRAVMEAALRRELGELVSWPTPKGGFFIWTMFQGPAGPIDTDALLKRAIAHRVVFVPGSAFFIGEVDRTRARLSFSAPSHEGIETGVHRLAAAVRGAIEAISEARARPDSAEEPPARAPARSTE